MMTKKVLYQTILIKLINYKEEGGRFPQSFFKIKEKYSNLGKYCPICVHLWVEFSF